MLLKGMRIDSKINRLDDIFNHDDLGLLADVKPIAPKADENAIDLLRKYSSHRINQSCNQIYP